MRKVMRVLSLLLILVVWSTVSALSTSGGEPPPVDKLQVQLELMKQEQAQLEAWLEKLSKYFASNPQMLIEIGKFRSSYIAGRSETRATLQAVGEFLIPPGQGRESGR